MTESETEPPILEYEVISGTRDYVQTRLTEAGRERWLLNGMSTCALPAAHGDPSGPTILMTCVIMRSAPAGPEAGEGES